MTIASFRWFKCPAPSKFSIDSKVLFTLVFFPPISVPSCPLSIFSIFYSSRPRPPAFLSSPFCTAIFPPTPPPLWPPHRHRECSWSSWTTCSTGSAAAGRPPTWSCCCSAAARSPTGWPPRCYSARPRASARSCSKSSSRSLPCECGWLRSPSADVMPAPGHLSAY